VTGAVTSALALAPRVFSTVGLPDRRRIELWEGHNAAALIGLRCQTSGPGALAATEINASAGQVQLARVAGSPHVVERTAADIRRAPAEAIATLAQPLWGLKRGRASFTRPRPRLHPV